METPHLDYRIDNDPDDVEEEVELSRGDSETNMNETGLSITIGAARPARERIRPMKTPQEKASGALLPAEPFTAAPATIKTVVRNIKTFLDNVGQLFSLLYCTLLHNTMGFCVGLHRLIGR